MKAVSIIVGIIALVSATSANAVVRPAPPDHSATIIQGDPFFQSLVTKMRVPTASGTVTVYREPCPGMTKSCAKPFTEIWVSPTSFDQPHSFRHEMGHVFDYNCLTNQKRAGFMLMTDTYDGPPATHWRLGETGATGYNHSPDEIFAEMYAFASEAGPVWRARRGELLPQWTRSDGSTLSYSVQEQRIFYRWLMGIPC